MLQHLVGIDAGFVTARARRPLDLVIVLPGADLHDVADIRQRIGQVREVIRMVPAGMLGCTRMSIVFGPAIENLLR